MNDTTQEKAVLEQAEERRCAALMAADHEALAAMLADDLVHIHLTGQVDGKSVYLNGVREKYLFRNITRGPLTIRLYGDFAVMTGPLSQQVEVKSTGAVLDVKAITTQTWLRAANGWLLNTCHNAALPA